MHGPGERATQIIDRLQDISTRRIADIRARTTAMTNLPRPSPGIQPLYRIDYMHGATVAASRYAFMNPQRPGGARFYELNARSVCGT